jgi:hypothetical protein
VLVLALCSLVTLGCALFFPDRKEELQPDLWRLAGSSSSGGTAAAVAAE